MTLSEQVRAALVDPPEDCSGDTHTMVLRLPRVLYEAVREQAAREDRSIAGMLRVMCRAYLDPPAPPIAGWVARQRREGWPGHHPETFCHRCGGPNVRSWWVDSTLWAQATAVMERGVDEILCPPCFTAAWESTTGLRATWELRSDLPTAPSGTAL